MNLFSGVGRLAKEVDLRFTNNNIAVANTTIAINRPFKNANGEREADFLRVIAFRKTAELLNEHFTKGKQIGITGRVQSRSFDDKEGKRQFITEIVLENITFISDGSNNQNQGTQQQNTQTGTNTPQRQNNTPQPQNNAVEENPFADLDGPVDIKDDDLPF